MSTSSRTRPTSVVHAFLLRCAARLRSILPDLSGLVDFGRSDGSWRARLHGSVVEAAFLLAAAHHTASRQGPAPFGQHGRLGLGFRVHVGVDDHPVFRLPKLMRLARAGEQRRKAPISPCRMQDRQPGLACRAEPSRRDQAQAAGLCLFPVSRSTCRSSTTGGALAALRIEGSVDGGPRAAKRVAHQEWLFPAGVTERPGATLGDRLPRIGVKASASLAARWRYPFQQVHAQLLVQAVANGARCRRDVQI